MGLILGKLKLYWWAIVAGIMAVMAAIIKFLTHRNSQLREKAEYAEAYAHRAKVIVDRDNELEAQARSHRAEVKREIEDTGDSSDFRDPNKLWRDSED